MSLQEVLAELRAADPARRKAALVRLVRTRDERAVPFLEKVIEHDPNAELRYLARKGIQALRGGAAREGPAPAAVRKAPEATLAERNPARLSQALASDRPRDRLKAVRLIRLDQVRDLVPQLAQQLARETEAPIQATLIEALGQLGDERVLMVLVPWLRHQDPRLRANCVEAIGQLDSEVGLAYLIPHLRDPDNRARANAVLALRRSGRVNVFRTLEDMLRSGSPSMQDSATFCLGRLGLAPRVFDLLEVAMESRFPVTRNQARSVLARLAERGSGRAESVLDRVGREPEAEEVEDLIEAAEILAPPEPEEALRDPEAEAARILRDLRGLGQVAGDIPGGEPDGSVAAALASLKGLTEHGEGDVERRSREVAARLASLGELVTEPVETPEQRADRVQQRLAALPREGGEFVDPAVLEEARLFNALQALG